MNIHVPSHTCVSRFHSPERLGCTWCGTARGGTAHGGTAHGATAQQINSAMLWKKALPTLILTDKWKSRSWGKHQDAVFSHLASVYRQRHTQVTTSIQTPPHQESFQDSSIFTNCLFIMDLISHS